MDAGPSDKRGSAWRCRLALAVVLLAGGAARVVGAWWYRHAQNPDYAVVVQMARHIAEGREWPVFFYGQSYMGSLEPSVSALLVALFGPAPFWVCLGTALFGIALLFAVHRWARDLGGPLAGVLAVAVVAIGPTGYFQYMASPRGGYAVGLLLTVLLLREGSRLAWLSRHQRNVPAGRCALLGFFGGLGLWNFWLTLPALAAAGLVLVAGLRWRILRFRVWFPGALGFAAGSLPFWLWNAQHGWTSFSAQESAAGRGQVVHAVRMLARERLPLLLDAVGSSGRVATVLVVHAVLLLLAVVALWPRSAKRWDLRGWTLSAVVLNAAAFTTAYALSSFSIPRTPRYLLPFVPLFAVGAGTAVAHGWQALRAAWGGMGTLRRARGLAVSAVGTVCLAAVIVGHAATLPLHRGSSRWFDTARELSAQLPARGSDAAMADYKLYGLNWAGDERFCFSSPQLERYVPSAQRLERADRPAVIENFRGFDHFLAATGTSATYERIAGYRVHSGAVAPSGAVRPVPPARLGPMTNGLAASCRQELTDRYASTVATFLPRRDAPATLDIALTEPTTVCGIRVWVHGDDRFGTWSIEGRPAGSEVYQPLSPPHGATGYYWSGPRFYFLPHDPREEKRFAPVSLDALRVTFHSKGDHGVARLSELQVLQPAGDAVTPDVAAIAAAVREHKLSRVYAGRWLANKLYDALEGDVWTSRGQPLSGVAEGAAAVELAEGIGIVAGVDAIDSVRLALGGMDVVAREVEVGGIVLFLLPDVGPEASAYRGLRYPDSILVHAHHRALADFWLKRAAALPSGQQEGALRRALEADPVHERVRLALADLLAHAGRTGEADELRRAARRERADVPMGAAFFDEGLILLGLSSWPSVVRAGEQFAFEAEWRLAPGFRCSARAGLFAHFLRDGRIAFQMDVPLAFRTDAFDSTADVYCRTYHSVTVPAGTAPGAFTPLLGLLQPGLLGRRVAVETDLPTLRRRIVVPGTFEVKE